MVKENGRKMVTLTNRIPIDLEHRKNQQIVFQR
jgi:hypothetical protein